MISRSKPPPTALMVPIMIDRGRNAHVRDQRLLHTDHRVRAQTEGIDVGDGLVEALDEPADCHARQAGQHDHDQIAAVGDHRRQALRNEQAVADQGAADTGHERHDEQADEIVTAANRRQRPCQSEEEHRAQVKDRGELEHPPQLMRLEQSARQCFNPYVIRH
jgi:hypothetical protein